MDIRQFDFGGYLNFPKVANFRKVCCIVAPKKQVQDSIIPVVIPAQEESAQRQLTVNRLSIPKAFGTHYIRNDNGGRENRSLFFCLYLILLYLLATGCQSVKPYQRAHLNDHEMQVGQKSASKPEQNAMSYREGATGGGGGKASGGCGCN